MQTSTDLVEQRHVKEADRQLKENKRDLSSLGEERAFGPETVDVIVVGYSHYGRISAEPLFAAMDGSTPL